MKTHCRIYAAIAIFLVAPLLRAQVWVTVAPESSSLSVTFPAGATYRMGDTQNNKWSASIPVATTTTISPTDFPDAHYPFPDPDSGVAKVLQVLEATSSQVVILSDSSVKPSRVTDITIPGTSLAATPAPTPAPTPSPSPASSASIPVPPGQVYIVTLSNISIVPGSADALVFNPTTGMVPLSQLIGTLLSGIQLNLTIDGTTLQCSFGQSFTDGTSNLVCAVPTPSSP